MTAAQAMELADEIERADGIYLMHSTKDGYQLGIAKTAQVIAAIRAAVSTPTGQPPAIDE